MALISNLNEGLLSSNIGKWLERGKKGAGPFDFAWSLGTSQGDLQEVLSLLDKLTNITHHET
jgi:hypothetical protein